ncbi:hypothetical protein [Paraburkholderia sediminicola]|uniref:hypothetical protein n=1 Tax=Paraburkholderia sediminicola TaxID=458836 RepID=UPI0038BDA218
MGTSTSSSGPGSSVPFDPPWLESLQTELGGDGTGVGGGETEGSEEPSGSESQNDFEPHQPDTLIAPPRRFAPARRELGGFARTGDGRAFRRAVGHYSRTGMGGARRAAGRMRAATVAAGGLVSFLQAARAGTDGAVRDWIQALTATAPSVREVNVHAIRWMLGHGDVEHLWHYLMTSIPGEMLKEVQAYFMLDALRNHPFEPQQIEMHEDVVAALEDGMERRFGTRRFDVVDTELLQSFLDMAVKKGLSALPHFFEVGGHKIARIAVTLSRSANI